VTRTRLRIGFAGTPDFAAISLKELINKEFKVEAVYTQPDRPAGRGRRLRPSPVKQLATRHGLAVLQPPSLRDTGVVDEMRALALDVLVVVAYGLILPPEILAAPKLGCINVHASLLPRWRGAAPVQRALLAGDEQTGVSIMLMDAGLDTGPILAQAACPIQADDTAGTLHDRLARTGADCLIETLERLGSDLAAHPQPVEGVSYAAKIDKAEARLDWTQPAGTLALQVRAFNPWPVANAEVAGLHLRVLEAQPVAGPTGDAGPGTICHCDGKTINIATGQGILRLQKVQLPGKKPISAADFINAHPRICNLGSGRQ